VVDVAVSVGRVVVALFLVLLNGFFVASEFAYVRVRATAVESLAAAGKPGSGALQDAMDNLDDYLAVTQLGITIASLGLGWIGEPAVAALIEPVLESVLPQGLIHLVAFAVGFGTITFLHVVFGELAPKTIAIAQAERIALAVAPPMKLFYYLFLPGIVVFNGTANAVTRGLGVPPAAESEETFTEREIRSVLARSGREGHVDAEEVEMIDRVFELDDVAVRDVMVPRPDAVCVSADTPIDDLRELIVEAGHTRYPVLDADDGEEVVGYVDAKDVLWADGAEDPPAVAGDIARDIVVVPETERVIDLLSTFRAERRQMAAVIDEWGAFEGLVTVEDILEVVVGDLRDEFDAPGATPSIEREGEGYLVDGGLPLEELGAELDADFDAGGFGTVGGLVLGELGRPPEVGDSVPASGYRLTVEAIDGARITSVSVRRAEDRGEESGAEGGDDQ